MAEDLDDIQPVPAPDTKPHLDVSKEPQTMSMRHREKGDAVDPPARLDKDADAPAGDEEAGNKTSLTWNE